MFAEKMMQLALREARRGQGQTWTNPLVGAVIACKDQVLATGYHAAFGQEHAEINALNQLEQTPEELQHATLYLTLEPCAHYGKQPPCVAAIRASGIRHVQVAQVDPNPLVRGQGIASLRDHGITVTVGLEAAAARALNPFYTYFYEQGRPWITLKQAASLDGKIAAKVGKRTAITHPETVQLVRQERAHYQAVLIGSETLVVDQPLLEARPSFRFPPIRIVLDRRGRSSSVYATDFFASKSPIWLFSQEFQPIFENLPQVRQWIAPSWSAQEVLAILAQEGIQSLYVEGGATIHQAFWETGLVDELLLYYAPQFLGSQGVSSLLQAPDFGLPPERKQWYFHEIRQIGPDVRLAVRREESSRCLPD